MKKIKDQAIWFILPSAIGFIIFFIFPFIISLGYAFLDKPVSGQFVWFQNFIGLFQNSSYQKALRNTVIFMGLCVPLNILCSLGISMVINNVKRYKQLFTLVFLIPLVIPSGSMVFFWKMMFANDGFINGIIVNLGGSAIYWLETGWALFVIVLIFIWKNLGYNIVLQDLCS